MKTVLLKYWYTWRIFSWHLYFLNTLYNENSIICWLSSRFCCAVRRSSWKIILIKCSKHYFNENYCILLLSFNDCLAIYDIFIKFYFWLRYICVCNFFGTIICTLFRSYWSFTCAYYFSPTLSWYRLFLIWFCDVVLREHNYRPVLHSYD